MPARSRPLLRTERTADTAAIGRVHVAAFGTDAEARLVEAIRHSDRFVPLLSIVAEVGGTIVGHIMLSYVDLVDESGHPAGRVLELAPLAVEPDRQRQGIGSALTRAALRSAGAMGEPLVLVMGLPGFYRRFGFSPARSAGLDPPCRVDDDVWMVRRLRPGRPASRHPNPRWRVVRPPAFLAVEPEAVELDP